VLRKREDFAQRKMLATTSPIVVWIRLPNTRRHELLAWFETVLPDAIFRHDHRIVQTGEVPYEAVGRGFHLPIGHVLSFMSAGGKPPCLAKAGGNCASTRNRIRHCAAPDGHFAALRIRAPQ
jgi:hypothetical protein